MNSAVRTRGPQGPLDRHATLGDLVEHALAGSVRRLVEHDHLVRLGDDPEGVHQARVATRRLRSDLHTFAPVLDTSWDDLRAELGWLGTLLGRVRDADVLVARLEERAALLSELDRPCVGVLTQRLRDGRSQDRGALLDAMASPRYSALLDRLGVVARAPTVTRDRADLGARRETRELARRPWQTLRRAIRSLPAHPTDGQLHQVRKRAKHARYALEAITPVAAPSVRQLAERVSDLQDVLGEHHDAVVAASWLRAVATTAVDDPHVAFAAGELAASFSRDALRRRGDWERSWRRARQRATDAF